ncbi:MFS transporter [Patescibacteria group bacterium]|nr:MFS transporter [Patescibacteria group bacterium]
MKGLLNTGLSRSTQIITYATTTRWFGWGIVDSIIPIFLYSLVNGFAETGLLKATYTILFFISLPIAGELADYVSLKKLLLIGLGIYFFIGGSYFIAAATGSILFVILARALNGISYAIDNTARETAFLRYESSTGKAFAVFETITQFWWLVAVASSLVIVPHVDIQWLFLGIIVTNLVAFVIMLRLPTMAEEHHRKIPSFKKISKNIVQFSSLRFFFKIDRIPVFGTAVLQGLVLTLPTSYLAIFSYLSSNDLREAILIGGIGALPGIMSMFIGKSSDTSPRRSFLFGMILLVASFIVLAFATSFVMQLSVAFLAGVGAQIIYLSSMVLVKKSSDEKYLGEIDSTLTSVGALSEIIGVVAIGYLIDTINLRVLGLSIAGILGFLTLFVFLWWKSKFTNTAT